MMTNGDPYRQIFLSYPYTKNTISFFLAHHCLLILFKNKLPEVPEHAEIKYYMMMSL